MTQSIFGFALARSSMIGEARKSSRRWTIVTSVGELRQEDRLLHRGVAATGDDHVLVPEERRVADGAIGDAAALQRALSESSPSWRALAPVATITARA